MMLTARTVGPLVLAVVTVGTVTQALVLPTPSASLLLLEKKQPTSRRPIVPPIVPQPPALDEVLLPAAAPFLFAVATAAQPSTAWAAAPDWIAPLSSVLDPVLFLAQFMMLCRVLLSWYPDININKLPYNLIAWPTEPLLRATRAIVPPAFGVDVSPIVWIAIASLARELLLGQQGILVLMATKG